MPSFELMVTVTRDDLDAEMVQFGLPWTDVIGPTGEISVGDPEEVEDPE